MYYHNCSGMRTVLQNIQSVETKCIHTKVKWKISPTKPLCNLTKVKLYCIFFPGDKGVITRQSILNDRFVVVIVVYSRGVFNALDEAGFDNCYPRFEQTSSVRPHIEGCTLYSTLPAYRHTLGHSDNEQIQYVCT